MYIFGLANANVAVLTFSACTPPLSEVLLLWDFLLAYGVHMNILAIISQLIILRDDILQHSSYFHHRLV